MSQANAAAIRRRSNPSTASQNARPNSSGSPSSATPSSAATTGLTLQQVISLVDKRLTALESNTNGSSETIPTGNFVETAVLDQIMESMTQEINNRFEILAEEIASLKDVVLKLQTYTMDVNKTLLQQVHVGDKPLIPNSFELSTGEEERFSFNQADSVETPIEPTTPEEASP